MAKRSQGPMGRRFYSVEVPSIGDDGIYEVEPGVFADSGSREPPYKPGEERDDEVINSGEVPEEQFCSSRSSLMRHLLASTSRPGRED